MQPLWKAERLFEEIRYMQDMLQDARPEWQDPRRDKIQLVEVCNYDDRSYSRYAYTNQECQYG